MKFKPEVLIVDDNPGDISWLIDLVEWRGYLIDQVGNERAARGKLEAVQERRAEYALAIVDIMVSIEDIMDIADFNDSFYEQSKDTGVRLCRYARQELGISAEKLPIVCISARDDEGLKESLAELGIPLFGRSDRAIRDFLKERLPKLD
ncbi:MAG: response regulator [bacterium]|nr:response regulator [bacterium]